ncbi:MAG TPA: ricin-type beta-trefoil lectin domain protein [Streptosporangiaceae bacterium]|nr:ricin-type beta-trefoil lectin domain protein [Streptosporangiaceae bacterium]
MRKKIFKLASLLAAGGLAAGLTLNLAGPAGASVNPAPGTFYELYLPDLANPSYNVCLDVPNASPASGVGMQIYHCHGYASNGGGQRWEMDWVGSGYEIVNLRSVLCLTWHTTSQAVDQEPCNHDIEEQWNFMETVGLPNVFQLYSLANTNDCLGAVNNSGGNSTQVTAVSCAFVGDPRLSQQYFALG